MGLVEGMVGMDGLEPVGLMTVPPWPADVSRAGDEARPYFVRLRELRDEVVKVAPGMTGLSMGMSNDFAVAIEEGSTVRAGGDGYFWAAGGEVRRRWTHSSRWGCDEWGTEKVGFR